MTLREKDVIVLVPNREAPEGWLYGKLQNTFKIGLVPKNYVERQ